MTDFTSAWNSDSFLTYPMGPLGLIAMPGTEEMGNKVNAWLKKWRGSPCPGICGRLPALSGRTSW